MDCDRYYNIDVEKTLDFLDKCVVVRDGFPWNKTSKRRIAALMAVHVFGNAVDLPPLMAACRKLNIPLVEDACESLGTYYTAGSLAGKHTGAVGDIGCFSFNGNKIVTCGGGGMIVTSDAALASRARYLTTQAKDDDVRFVHHEVGYNYRLTNLQAAVGVAQLEQIQNFISTKKRNFLLYRVGLADTPGLSLGDPPPYANCNMWLYCLQIQQEHYGADRDAVMAHLADGGVQTRPVWYLNHMQRPYAACESYHIERACSLYECTLNLPSSSNLSHIDIERILGYLTK
jgi:dTDP-4-amino-4,6-dideoxygalactose transaminase